MAGSIGRAARRLLYRVLSLVLLAALSYGAWAWFQLNRAMDAAGPGKRSYALEVVSPSASVVKTSLPIVLRAGVKRLDAQNWLPADTAGLVEMRLAWSPGDWKWIGDPPPPLPFLEQKKLEALSILPPPPLIDALTDEDLHKREVAGQALKLDTGKDFGYRFDLPPAKRAEAVCAWKKWWEENKIRYPKEKLEKIFKGPEAAPR